MNQNKKIIRYYLTFFSILLTLFTSGIYSFDPPHIADLDSDLNPPNTWILLELRYIYVILIQIEIGHLQQLIILGV